MKPIYRYREKDFELSNGLEIMSVKTVIADESFPTKLDSTNYLFTFWEKAKIKYATTSNILYKRLNHVDFRYELHVRNPGKVAKKVLFRIWLGLLSDEKDVKLGRDELFEILTIIFVSAPSSLTPWWRWTSLWRH